MKKIERFIYIVIILIVLTNPVLGTTDSSEQPTNIDKVTCFMDHNACSSEDQFNQAQSTMFILIIGGLLLFLKWRNFI